LEHAKTLKNRSVERNFKKLSEGIINVAIDGKLKCYCYLDDLILERFLKSGLKVVHCKFVRVDGVDCVLDDKVAEKYKSLCSKIESFASNPSRRKLALLKQRNKLRLRRSFEELPDEETPLGLLNQKIKEINEVNDEKLLAMKAKRNNFLTRVDEVKFVGPKICGALYMLSWSAGRVHGFSESDQWRFSVKLLRQLSHSDTQEVLSDIDRRIREAILNGRTKVRYEFLKDAFGWQVQRGHRRSIVPSPNFFANCLGRRGYKVASSINKLTIQW